MTSRWKRVRRTIFLGLILAVPAAAAEEAVPYTGENATGEIRLPAGEGPFPAVILLHGCGGLSERVQQGLSNHAAILRERGYATFVLDSFSARDLAGGAVCESLDLLARARRYRQHDVIQAVAHLATMARIDSRNVFVVGQSNGGSVALALATGKTAAGYPDVPPLRAIAAYYPWCGELSSTISIPLLVLGAGQDDWVSPAACEFRQSIMQGAPYEVVIYPQAHHSFDLPIAEQTYAGHTVGGNEAATRDSREKILAWFASHASPD